MSASSIATVVLGAVAMISACGGSGPGAPPATMTSSDAGGSSPNQPGVGTLGDGGASTPGDSTPGSEGGSSGGEDAALDVAVNPNPTVSSWLGTNADVDLPRSFRSGKRS